MSYLYILEVNPLSVVSFAIVFSHSEGYFFTFLIVSFDVKNILSFIGSNLFTFFPPLFLERWSIEDLALIYVIECSADVLL